MSASKNVGQPQEPVTGSQKEPQREVDGKSQPQPNLRLTQIGVLYNGAQSPNQSHSAESSLVQPSGQPTPFNMIFKPVAKKFTRHNPSEGEYQSERQREEETIELSQDEHSKIGSINLSEGESGMIQSKLESHQLDPAISEQDRRLEQKLGSLFTFNIEQQIADIVQNLEYLQIQDVIHPNLIKEIENETQDMGGDQKLQIYYHLQQLFNDLSEIGEDIIPLDTTAIANQEAKFQANANYYESLAEAYESNLSNIFKFDVEILQQQAELAKLKDEYLKQQQIKRDIEGKRQQLRRKEDQIMEVRSQLKKMGVTINKNKLMEHSTTLGINEMSDLPQVLSVMSPQEMETCYKSLRFSTPILK